MHLRINNYNYGHATDFSTNEIVTHVYNDNSIKKVPGAPETANTMRAAVHDDGPTLRESCGVHCNIIDAAVTGVPKRFVRLGGFIDEKGKEPDKINNTIPLLLLPVYT